MIVRVIGGDPIFFGYIMMLSETLVAFLGLYLSGSQVYKIFLQQLQDQAGKEPSKPRPFREAVQDMSSVLEIGIFFLTFVVRDCFGPCFSYADEKRAKRLGTSMYEDSEASTDVDRLELYNRDGENVVHMMVEGTYLRSESEFESEEDTSSA